MLTLEEAQALKPGDKLRVATYLYGGTEYTVWEVYEPATQDRWDSDHTIVKYMRSREHPWLRGYVFSDKLYRYSLLRGRG